MGRVIPIRQPEESIGLMHVRLVDGAYEVAHESASGGSFGLFARFDERDEAIAFAVRQLPHIGRCKLGRIDE